MRPHTIVAKRLFLPLWVATSPLILASAAPAQETAAPAARVITDFDRVRARVTASGQLRLAEVVADGNKLVRITSPAGGGRNGQLLYALPEDARPLEDGGFSFRARSVGGVADVRLVAADARGRVILQRRLKIEPADKLQPLAFPWTNWRWGDVTIGAPAEIRAIGLRFESQGAELELDDLALTAAAQGQGGKEWLRRVAFGGRDVRMAESDGLLVATDAVEGPEQLTDADLSRIVGRMVAARKLVRRVFEDAARPLDGPVPPALLIFREQADYLAYFEALGKEWNVGIRPPTSGGYTVQNVCATTFDPRQGADRPVFLHESVHVVFANDVRLHSGHDRHSWLHEGLAAYVQISVYPKSVDRRALAGNFRRRIKADGSGFFKPLDPMLEKVVPVHQQAQVATVVAYLLDQKPKWLPLIAKALADGASVGEALKQCGTTLPELQDAWMKWGAEKVGADGDAGAMLPVLPEFAPDEAAPAGQK